MNFYVNGFDLKMAPKSNYLKSPILIVDWLTVHVLKYYVLIQRKQALDISGMERRICSVFTIFDIFGRTCVKVVNMVHESGSVRRDKIVANLHWALFSLFNVNYARVSASLSKINLIDPTRASQIEIQEKKLFKKFSKISKILDELNQLVKDFLTFPSGFHYFD